VFAFGQFFLKNMQIIRDLDAYISLFFNNNILYVGNFDTNLKGILSSFHNITCIDNSMNIMGLIWK
jgi:hypothetical protein